MPKEAPKLEHIHKGQKGLDILVLIITLSTPKGYMDGSTTFLKKIGNISPKKNYINLKWKKKSDLGGFSIFKSEKEKKKKSPDFSTWFLECVANI